MGRSLRPWSGNMLVLIAASWAGACSGRVAHDAGAADDAGGAVSREGGVDSSPDGVVTDGAVRDRADDGTPCGPGSCSGCCSALGVCEWGGGDVACGNGGQACIDCSVDGAHCHPISHQCQSPPACGPAMCNAGCCDPASGACLDGYDAMACGTLGEPCRSCADVNLPCVPTGWGGGRCEAPPEPCGPWNCPGCCAFNGTEEQCLAGDNHWACGAGGGLCTVCGESAGCGTWPDGTGMCFVSNECPAPYAGCPPDLAIPQPDTAPGACSQATLDQVLALCAGPSLPTPCYQLLTSLQHSAPACGQCLAQFVGPNAGDVCLAPHLSDGCNHALACTSECQAVACAACPPSESESCWIEVLWNDDVCSGYVEGLLCLQAALKGDAWFCGWDGDAGKWLYTVGSHYCGGGTP